MRRARGALATLAVALAAASCGGDAGAADRVVVSAAASLRDALGACSGTVAGARVRTSFGGSDELAAQIRRGVRADVFAAANIELPQRLAAEGLVAEPRVFATNELVIAVPAASRIDALSDLAAPGVDVAVGARNVPVGAYAREVLARAGRAVERAVLANVRTEEPDVRGVVGKLRQGAADAGLVYATDVRAAGGALRAVRLPRRLRPDVAYGVSVVRGAPNPAAARAFVDDLAGGRCQDELRRAGFGRAP